MVRHNILLKYLWSLLLLAKKLPLDFMVRATKTGFKETVRIYALDCIEIRFWFL